MVITNFVIPQIVEKKLNEEFETLPFFHRTQSIPKEEAVEKLKNILDILKVDFNFKDNSPATFSKLLESIKNHPKEKYLSKKITTTLQKAIYTAARE
jgi:exoribonuclease R